MILLCSISYASDSLCRKPTCSSAAAASSALPLTRSDQMVKLQQSELPSCTSPPNSHVATLSLTLFTYLLVLPTAIFLPLFPPPPLHLSLPTSPHVFRLGFVLSSVCLPSVSRFSIVFYKSFASSLPAMPSPHTTASSADCMSHSASLWMSSVIIQSILSANMGCGQSCCDEKVFDCFYEINVCSIVDSLLLFPSFNPSINYT